MNYFDWAFIINVATGIIIGGTVLYFLKDAGNTIIDILLDKNK
ncbi:MAG: hypothetical protein PHQ42_04250 [Patescibacteria group bacterium]|nr:hypothetical protein [Patescibacteria group bacterium]